MYRSSLRVPLPNLWTSCSPQLHRFAQDLCSTSFTCFSLVHIEHSSTWHRDTPGNCSEKWLLLSVQGGLSPDELAEAGKEASRLEATVVAVKALKEHLQVKMRYDQGKQLIPCVSLSSQKPTCDTCPSHARTKQDSSMALSFLLTPAAVAGEPEDPSSGRRGGGGHAATGKGGGRAGRKGQGGTAPGGAQVHPTPGRRRPEGLHP